MTSPSPADARSVGSVTVRYWAAARAAAGVDCDEVPIRAGTTLADLLDAVPKLHPDRPRLPDVVAVCSVLLGERPVGSADPSSVPVDPGSTVELLPPFAGG